MADRWQNIYERASIASERAIHRHDEIKTLHISLLEYGSGLVIMSLCSRHGLLHHDVVKQPCLSMR